MWHCSAVERMSAADATGLLQDRDEMQPGSDVTRQRGHVPGHV